MSALSVRRILLAISVVTTFGALLVPCVRRAVLERSEKRSGPDLARVALAPQLGTRHPIRVIKVGSGGRWVVACQARVDSNGDGRIHIALGTDGVTGDELAPYLFRGGVGEGEPLDALLDQSPDGRWIVVVRDSKLVVIDAQSWVEQEIRDADVSPGQGGYDHVARLDDQGTRLLYFRGSGRHTLVIRELADRRERVVRVDSPVVSLAPEHDSPWIALWLPPPPRVGVITHYEAFSTRSARAQTCEVIGTGMIPPWQARRRDAWINVETGEIQKSASVMAHLDGVEVLQAADGAVHVGATMLVPIACGADVRMASAHPLRLIVACRHTGPNAPLEMFGPDMHVTLPGTDRENSFGGRSLDPVLVGDSPFICLQHKACFALDDGRAIHVPGEPWDVRGPYIVSFQDRPLVTDARSGVTTPLLPVARMQRRDDRIERIGSLVVDLSLVPPRAVRELGRSDEAIDDRGRVLTEALPPLDDSSFSWGPLRWVDPEL